MKELLGAYSLSKVTHEAIYITYDRPCRGCRTDCPSQDHLGPGPAPHINGALSQVDFGDSARVRPGLYKENIEMIQGVVLKGEDPYTTIIDGGRKGPTVLGASQAVISGFMIRNGITGIL